jgi:hypothetical protein
VLWLSAFLLFGSNMIIQPAEAIGAIVQPPVLIDSAPGEIRLQMIPPQDAVVCEIMMDNGKGAELSTLVYQGDCLQTALLQGLLVDHNYRFEMRGQDTANTYSPFSNMVSYVAAGRPEFASGFRPELTKIGASDVRVSWEAPDARGSPVLGFVVMQDVGDWTGSSNNWEVLYNGTTNPNVFETSVSGLNPEMVYAYRVYAVNRVGTSAYAESRIQLAKLMAAPLSRTTMLPSTVQSSKQSSIKVQSVDPITGMDENE